MIVLHSSERVERYVACRYRSSGCEGLNGACLNLLKSVMNGKIFFVYIKGINAGNSAKSTIFCFFYRNVVIRCGFIMSQNIARQAQLKTPKNWSRGENGDKES